MVDVEVARRGNAEGLKRLLELIRSFVEEGGGIALQAGTEYHNPLQMLGTPLADLLPLSVTEADRKATEAIDRSSAIRLRLTEAGRAHPAFNILPPDSRGERPDPERVARIWANEDERVDVSEGYQAFTAAKVVGVPAKFLYFPDEGHWVLRPRNRRVWWSTVLDWLSTYLETPRP